jgi:glycosyltransferase involved in cell wall biosynthesis
MNRDVCFLSTTRFFGGGEIFLVKLAALLQHHIRLVVVSPPMPALHNGLAELNAGFVDLSADTGLALRWAFLRWLWRQRHIIRTRKTPIVLNGRGAAYLAPMVRLLTGVAPVIISQTALSMRPGDIKEALYGIAARFARCIVAVSDSVATQHHQRWPGLVVESIPNWIELRQGVTEVSRQIPSSIDTLRVALVSRLVQQKGIEDVVAACVTEEGIDLHVYGDGPMHDQLRNSGSQRERVHFHGHVNDLPQRLPKHSVLISGSYSESFSYSVAEGIQAGLLCVVTDIPAHRELLGVSYPDELFFPPGDRAALKRALRAARTRLCKDHGEDAYKVVSGAQAHIAEHNSPERARQRYLAILSAARSEGHRI